MFGRRCPKMILPFQSTPPARGATEQAGIFGLLFDISIHAPREGGDFSRFIFLSGSMISIHAPREGGAKFLSSFVLIYTNFNPRPPRGGRLREPLSLPYLNYFNPRPPRGGRRNAS